MFHVNISKIWSKPDLASKPECLCRYNTSVEGKYLQHFDELNWVLGSFTQNSSQAGTTWPVKTFATNFSGSAGGCPRFWYRSLWWWHQGSLIAGWRFHHSKKATVEVRCLKVVDIFGDCGPNKQCCLIQCFYNATVYWKLLLEFSINSPTQMSAQNWWKTTQIFLF